MSQQVIIAINFRSSSVVWTEKVDGSSKNSQPSLTLIQYTTNILENTTTSVKLKKNIYSEEKHLRNPSFQL